MGILPLIVALFPQSQPLVNTETMLFVNDDQAQALEHHIGLKQGMGADHHRQLARRQLAEHGAPRLGAELTRQPTCLHLQRRQPGTEILEVLFGQQFGGRHHHRLITRLHRLQYRGRRHQGLAGSHVSLYQALHGVGITKVGANLSDDPLLRPGQPEGQAA